MTMVPFHASFRRLVASAVIASAVAFAGTAGASPAAKSFVKEKQSRLTKLLKAKAKASQLHTVFDAMLDYDRLAKDSLDEHWGKLTPAQRKEFKTVLTGLVRQSYTRNLRKTLKYQVAYEGVTNGKRGVVVTTVARNAKNKRELPYTIAYVVTKKGSGFAVIDIITEQESMVFNYRRQFSRIIQKKGYAELIARMRKKLGS